MSRATANVVSILDNPSAADELGAEITELCSYLHAAEFKLLSLIRRFDENEYWAQQGFCSCAHWLNFHCGVGLSFSKVRAMTRIADASNEDYLLMIAKHGTAHHVEKLVSKFRTVKRLQDAELAVEQRKQREVTYYYDDDGSLVIKGRLPAEQGALIVKALEMAMDKQFVDEDPDEREPIAARRADALAEVAETYLNNSESSGSTADRYQVVVHVQAATGEAETEDGPHVTAVTSERIACDSSVVVIKEDDNGEPLSIGRRSRSIPPPMRRALRARDKGCRFPGCTNTRFVDGHHIEHWAEGGETSLDNLVTLCRHHHHLVHEGGFVCEKAAGGEVVFKDPRQKLLRAEPREVAIDQLGSPSNDELQHWLDSAFIDDDVNACADRWYAGERMDWQMAVPSLF